MKKTMNRLVIPVIFLAMISTGCDSPKENVEDAKEKVKEAKEDLTQANKDYLEDMEKYRIEKAEKIAANERSIKEFNNRIAFEKKEAKEDYKKKIADLEKRNSDMKLKLANYKADGKKQWEAFKTEFSHDMDNLGKALKDLAVSNK